MYARHEYILLYNNIASFITSIDFAKRFKNNVVLVH